MRRYRKYWELGLSQIKSGEVIELVMYSFYWKQLGVLRDITEAKLSFNEEGRNILLAITTCRTWALQHQD